MKALLLAGGKGTRLKPLTNHLPKPMVPIVGKPLLERTILNLAENGFTEIIISLCYQPREIDTYFGDGSSFGVKIKYVREDIPLGTGGAIRNAEPYIDTTFAVLNSDIVTDINLNELMAYHREMKGIATIALTSVENPTQYGIVELNNGCISMFKEKPKPHEVTSSLINAGIYVFEPEILKYIPADQVVSIERNTFPLLLSSKRKIAGYTGTYYWMDIGTPEKYIQAHNDILSNKALFTKMLKKPLYYGNIFHEFNIKLGIKSRIIGPAYLGNNVDIGAKAVIGPYAVLCDNVKIGSGSRISNSIMWDNVEVGKTTSIANTIIGSYCKIDNTIEICDSIFVNDIAGPEAI